MRQRKTVRPELVFFFIILVIFISLLVWLFFKVKSFFLESNLFSIKRVVVNLKEDIPFEIKGKGIFSLDIKKLSTQLRELYPQYKNVVVKRVFPDTILIEFERRKPLFQVKLKDKFWLLDKELIVISGPAELMYPNSVLVETSLPPDLDIYPGKRISFPHEDEVIYLLTLLEEYNFFKDFKVTYLYSYTINDIRFNLDEVEIRIGKPPYQEKLRLLKKVILPPFKKDISDIAYIDLRFKEPVIGYRR